MTRQIGRNAKCTCGSGKKYKKCCLERERNSPFRLRKLYAVEDMPPDVRAMHMQVLLGFPGERENPDEIKIGIERLLHDALRKKADHERLIFLDVNVPGGKPFSDASHWLNETIDSLKSYQKNEALPSALIVATNHSHHYAEDNVVPKHGDATLGGFRRDDLKIDDVEKFRRDHPEYWDLITAVNFLDEIPQFDC